jgi:hypothetical protein
MCSLLNSKYDYEIITPVWRHFPSLIKWKQKNRIVNNSNDNYLLERGINYSIIFDLTTLIEGCFYEMYFLGQNTRNTNLTDEQIFSLNNTMYYRLANELYERMNVATWSDVNELFYLCFGKIIKEEIDNERWKSISILFSFRNLLIHGKPIYVEYAKNIEKEEPNILVKNKHKTVYNYLLEKKLITKGDNLESVLISNTIADHFVSETFNFIKESVMCVDESIRNDLIDIVLDEFD